MREEATTSSQQPAKDTPQTPVSFTVNRLFILESLLIRAFAAVFLTFVIIAVLASIKYLNFSTYSALGLGIFGLTFAALSAPITILALRLNPLPIRVEFKNRGVVLYFRYRSQSISADDIDYVRRPTSIERIFALREKNAFVLVTTSKKRLLVQPGTLDNPIRAAESFRRFLRPALRRAINHPPRNLLVFPKLWPIVPLVLMGSFFSYLFYPVFEVMFAGIPPWLISAGIVLGPSITKIALGTKRLEFSHEGILSRTLRESPFVRFSIVKYLYLKAGHSKESLSLLNAHDHTLITLTSDLPDFPAIRDFIILNCPEAQVTGGPDTRDLDLYAFDVPPGQVNQESNPEPYHPAQSEIEPPSPVVHQNQAGGQ